jgi:hypothetical protein
MRMSEQARPLRPSQRQIDNQRKPAAANIFSPASSRAISVMPFAPLNRTHIWQRPIRQETAKEVADEIESASLPDTPSAALATADPDLIARFIIDRPNDDAMAIDLIRPLKKDKTL